MISLENAIEAVLFASDQPVTVEDLENVFQHPNLASFTVDKQQILNALDFLLQKYAKIKSGVLLIQVNGGYQFVTHEDYSEIVRIATVNKEKKKLSKSALETLSIIAYKQPITKAEIEHIRGVNSDYAIQKLLEQQLIEIAGRADLPGKPLIYRTSQAFFQYFKINSLSDLPKLNEIKSDEETIAEEFKNIISLQNKEVNEN